MSSMNLYVGNLSYNLSEEELNELFAAYGTVLSAKIITDRYSGQSRGFGFVEMSTREEGEAAISSLNGQEVLRRQIRVNEARPRAERPRGGRGGRPGGGYDSDRDSDRY